MIYKYYTYDNKIKSFTDTKKYLSLCRNRIDQIYDILINYQLIRPTRDQYTILNRSTKSHSKYSICDLNGKSIAYLLELVPFKAKPLVVDKIKYNPYVNTDFIISNNYQHNPHYIGF